MPFRGSEYRGTYGPSEIALLEHAYKRCCELVGRYPSTDEDKDRLARLVLRVFESSQHDPELAAHNAAQIERHAK